MPNTQTRRRFLTTISAAAGAAGLVRAPPARAAADPLETTTVRLTRVPAICQAPQYIAEELMRSEGFTDIRYVNTPTDAIAPAVGRGEADFGMAAAIDHIQAIDAGTPIVLLAGVHVGCFELFGREGVRSIIDLKGRSVGVDGLGSPHQAFVAIMAAHVGLDPIKDIRWVTSGDPKVSPLELFVEGKVDAFLGFPPEPQDLRARRVGHVLVSTALDRPWSQYYCCMLAGRRDYIRKYPVATKHVLRAILKAADFCASEPARAAQLIVERGFAPRYDYALQTLSEVPYDKWRDYEPEDTMRFYALRLHEAGLIKSNPHIIISEGADWRFSNEIRRELKA
jgi:NitT/TauT family transport system substrate-binding protein